MNRDQAIQAAQQIGVQPGDEIFMQSEGQITHPHYHHGQLAGEQHVDGWHVQNQDGQYQASKIHSDGR